MRICQTKTFVVMPNLVFKDAVIAVLRLHQFVFICIRVHGFLLSLL